MAEEPFAMKSDEFVGNIRSAINSIFRRQSVGYEGYPNV